MHISELMDSIDTYTLANMIHQRSRPKSQGQSGLYCNGPRMKWETSVEVAIEIKEHILKWIGNLQEKPSPSEWVSNVREWEV